MVDHPDYGKWLEYHGEGSGKHLGFVFALTPNWKTKIIEVLDL